jgi:hypothetical protein
VSQLRTALAEEQGESGNPEKGERLPLEDFTRGLLRP